MTVTGVIGGCLIILGFVPGGFIWRSVGARVPKEPSSHLYTASVAATDPWPNAEEIRKF